jgi:late competence protein required for DNA uptake (superfamily II DNA/RNA helicase)
VTGESDPLLRSASAKVGMETLGDRIGREARKESRIGLILRATCAAVASTILVSTFGGTSPLAKLITTACTSSTSSTSTTVIRRARRRGILVLIRTTILARGLLIQATTTLMGSIGTGLAMRIS